VNSGSDTSPTHSATQGAALVIFTVLCWGSLPLVLKVLVSEIDPVTITWYRFSGAALIIALVSGRGGIDQLKVAFRESSRPLLLIAGTGLTANYVFFMGGLRFLTPGVAQIVMQLSPLFVVIGGVFLFNEPFLKRQWLGVGLLAIGCALFFNQQYAQVHDLDSDFILGAGLLVLAAASWSGYLLAQKKLLQTLSSRTLMLICYLTGIVVLGLDADHRRIQILTTETLLVLLLSIAITVTSYLAFATALRHIQASKAGLAIANIPLVTIVGSTLLAPYIDRLPEENLNTVSIIGAILVVTGSAIGTVGATTSHPQPPPE
jgi:drug/metabolite transporter (DMT)-like permease